MRPKNQKQNDMCERNVDKLPRTLAIVTFVSPFDTRCVSWMCPGKSGSRMYVKLVLHGNRPNEVFES